MLQYSDNSFPRFSNPPNEVGVPQYRVPYHGYIVLVEKIDRNKGDFKILEPSENHVYEGIDANKYPSPLYLVRQVTTPDGKWVFRYWCNDRSYEIQDTWNYGQQFAGENNNFPIYVRNYITPRVGYTPQTKKSPVKGLLGIQLTSAGADYTSPPLVTIEGSDAEAETRIDETGKVTAIYLTKTGTIISPPIEITISGGEGSGATAQAIYQPQDAVLIKEEMRELPIDDPLHSRYVQVIQFYSTIPGPWFEYSRQEEDGSITYMRRRQNWIEDIVEGENVSDGTWTATTKEPAENTDFISWEIKQTRSNFPNPSGPGNGGTDPGYNTGWLISTETDADGKVIYTKRRLNLRANITPGEKIVGSYWVDISIAPKSGSELLVWEVVTYREVEGPDITAKGFGDQSLVKYAKDGIYHTIVSNENISVNPDTSINIITSDTQPVTSLRATKRSILAPDGFQSLVHTNLLDNRGLGAVSTTTQSKTTPTDSLPSVDYLTLEATRRVLNAKQSEDTVAKMSSAPILYGTKYDPKTGGLVDTIKTFVANGTVGSYNPSDGTIVEIIDHDRLKSIQITSKLRSFPSSRQKNIKYNYSFPDTLEFAQYYSVWATSGGSMAYDVGLATKITEGYSGPCDAVLHEFFTRDPSSISIPSIWKCFPEAYRSLGYFAFAGDSVTAWIREFVIPPTLHGFIDPTPMTPPNEAGDFYTDIPATTPTAVPWGSTICVDAPEPEEWAGITIVRYVMLQVPTKS